jgi:hypothetical protein
MRVRLGQQIESRCLVFCFHLQADATDKVGHLAIKANQVLVAKKYINAGGFKQGAGHNRLGETRY